MEPNYLCPHCRSFLRVWNNIIFTVRRCEDDRKGLILLNAKLGDYTVISHPALTFEEGECVEFICPVCHKNLTAENINDKLAYIIMKDEEGVEFDIYFSKIAGEHTTFKIERNNIIAQYGEDATAYMSYFMSKLSQNINES